MSKIYPAKILMFGEYIALRGSDTLAIPTYRFSGQWSKTQAPDTGPKPMDLQPFFEHLTSLQRAWQLPFRIDLERMATDLEEGFYFRSNIPIGYGMGSSGALCAAVLERFGEDIPQDPRKVKQGLARMESFFHGNSSGTDPLVSWYRKPTLIAATGQIEWPELSGAARELLNRFFLVDTGRRRQTKVLIERYAHMCADNNFLMMVDTELIPASRKAIRALLDGNGEALEEALRQISQLQRIHYQPMIHADHWPLWQRGFEGNEFILKLCGAGGGGYMLGYRLDENLRDLDGMPIVDQIFG